MDKKEALLLLRKTMTTIAGRIDVVPTEEEGWLACQYITDFGRCLAFGVETAKEDGYPAPSWARRGINSRIETLPVISELIDEISFHNVDHRRICEVLDGMLRVWFVELAAQYSYDTWFDSMNRYDFMLKLAIRDLLDAVRELDQLLMERSPLFCRESCYALLREYRQDMDPKLNSAHPWWLRGGLERQSPKIRQ